MRSSFVVLMLQHCDLSVINTESDGYLWEKFTALLHIMDNETDPCSAARDCDEKICEVIWMRVMEAIRGL